VVHFPNGTQTPAVPGGCPWTISSTIPSASFPIKNAIFGVYQDTNIKAPPVTNPSVQNVNYYVDGTAPNRVFIANFNELPLYSSGSECVSSGLQTSQIILYEATNVIDVLISRRNIVVPTCTWNAIDGAGVVGVININGAQAVVPPGRNTGSWSTTNEAWRFTPAQTGASNTVLTWLANGNPIAGTTDVNPITVCPIASTVYTAVATYTQCDGSTVVLQDTGTVGPEAALPVRDPLPLTICATGAAPYNFNIDQNGYMLNGASPSDFVFTYHVGAASGPIIPNATLTNYSSAGAGEQIWVQIEDQNTTGCTNFRSFTLNTTASPSGTFNYPSSPYCANITTAQLPNTTTLTAGGTYTSTPVGLTLDSSTGAIIPSSSITGVNYTVTYDIPASATCPAYSTSSTVTINPVLSTTVNCGITTTSSIQFNWTAVAGATDYSVSYQINANPTVNVGAVGNILTYSVTGLSPGDTVLITITPIGPAGSCFNSSSQSCIATNCVPATAAISYATPFCISDVLPKTVNITGTGAYTGGTYSSSTGLTLNSSTGVIIPNTSTPGTYTVNYSVASLTAGCPPTQANTSVTIYSQPNAGTDGTTVTCDSNTTTILLNSLITGEDAGGIWTQSSGSGGIFNASAGTFTPAIGATNSTFTYTLTANSPCIDDSSLVTININPAPSATISGTTNVCSGTGSTITFNGTPNAEVTYTINGGTNQTIMLDASGNASLLTGNLSTTTVYNLVSVRNTVTSCSQNITGTATVTVVGLPTVTISGTTTICSGTASTIIFSGTPNTVVTYTINGGTNQTISIDATGNASLSTGNLTANATYSLVSVATSSPIVCSQLQTGNAIVTVTGMPTATISGSTTICSGTGTTITFNGTANALVSYTINGGSVQTITLDGTGNASLPTGNLSSTATYTLTQVFNGCTTTLSQNAVVTIIPLSSITLTSATGTDNQAVCANIPIANITYSVGSGVTSASITAGSLPAGINGTFASGIFTISGTSNAVGNYNYTITTNGGCAPDATISGTIAITSAPSISLASAGGTNTQSLCENNTLVNIDYTIGGSGTGAEISAGSLPNGVTGTFTGNTFSISGLPTSTGTYNYTVSSTGGCTPGVSMSGTITVIEIPKPILTPGYICVDTNNMPTGNYTIETQLDDVNYTFKWYDSNGIISGATQSFYIATNPGIYSVIASSNTTPSCPAPIASVTINPSLPPTSMTVVASNYFAELQTLTVNVLPIGNYLYQLDNGIIQNSSIFTNVNSGSHTIKVTDVNQCGELTQLATIVDYPKFFTPNNDGYHDTWNISALSNQSNSKIEIFDRMGKLIKIILPTGNGWNGTFNEKPLPATDYWFVVYYKENNLDKIFKSHFALKR